MTAVNTFLSILCVFVAMFVHFEYNFFEVDKMTNKEFGQYLKQLRKQQGLTQKQLSELSGLSISAINKYETGQRKCSFAKASIIAAALRVPFSDLVAFWDDEKEQGNYTTNKTIDAVNHLIKDYGYYFEYGADNGFYLVSHGKRMRLNMTDFQDFINAATMDIAVNLGRLEVRISNNGEEKD